MRQKPLHLAYFLPNLLTAASIFSGVLSVIHAIEMDFSTAAWLTLLALVFDGLDGRVARLTKTSSRFGLEFDSLADIVAFGVAPSILVYIYVGSSFGRLGIVVSALFVIFGAIRLARFNVMSAQTEPSVFIGVPIPTAAVFISIMVLFFEKYSFKSEFGIFILIATVCVAFLMVSNIRYPSFKKIDSNPQNVMKIFVFVLFIGLAIFMYPIEGFLLFSVVYLLYGPLRALYLFAKVLNKKAS